MSRSTGGGIGLECIHVLFHEVLDATGGEVAHEAADVFQTYAMPCPVRPHSRLRLLHRV
jgi:hypothetical protein